jgi:hypothetical protein
MRQLTQKQEFTKILGPRSYGALPLLASVVFLAGCQGMLGRAPGQAAYQGPAQPPLAASYQPEENLNALQPAAGPSRTPLAQQTLGYAESSPYQAPYQGYGSPAFAALEGNQLQLKQRLDRIEQALLRLDRRMQLVERNELGRMGGANPPSQPLPVYDQVSEILPAVTPLAQTVRQTMQTDNWGSEPIQQNGLPALAQAAIPAAAPTYAEGFAPVSQVDTTIRGTLQAAPRLPSLADATATAQGRIPQSAGNMAVWTVRYEPEKVWPDRTQLPGSKSVVELLRKSETVTLVARGPKPTSPEFQERVRALSRYLAKVAALETVPISTLATPQLDGDTIELLATP